MAGPVRIVVIEDSPLLQAMLVDLYQDDPQLRVVACASSQVEGVAAVLEYQPDLVSVDLGLPDGDGFQVVQQVMAQRPTPMVVLTATLRPTWRREAYYALSLGALDVWEKPSAADMNDPGWRRRLHRAMHVIAHASVTKPSASEGPGPRSQSLWRQPEPPEVILFGGSSGAARSIHTVMTGLHGHLPLRAPLVLALHLGRNMGMSLASYLQGEFGLPSQQAEAGQLLRPGHVYVLPGQMHAAFSGHNVLRIFDTLPGAAWVPSLDHFFTSAAEVYGRRAMGIVFSGMGNDGSQGLRAMRQRGALTLAQDEASALIDNMPRAAFQTGGVSERLTPADLAAVVWRSQQV